jgi:hypothetical protein
VKSGLRDEREERKTNPARGESFQKQQKIFWKSGKNFFEKKANFMDGREKEPPRWP